MPFLTIILVSLFNKVPDEFRYVEIVTESADEMSFSPNRLLAVSYRKLDIVEHVVPLDAIHVLVELVFHVYVIVLKLKDEPHSVAY